MNLRKFSRRLLLANLDTHGLRCRTDLPIIMMYGIFIAGGTV